MLYPLPNAWKLGRNSWSLWLADSCALNFCADNATHLPLLLDGGAFSFQGEKHVKSLPINCLPSPYVLELIQAWVTKEFGAALHSRLPPNTNGFPAAELAVAFSVAPGPLRRAVAAACFSTWTAPCPGPLERGREPSFTEPSGGFFICCTIVLFVCFCCFVFTPQPKFPLLSLLPVPLLYPYLLPSSSSASLQTLVDLPRMSASHGIPSCTETRHLLFY